MNCDTAPPDLRAELMFSHNPFIITIAGRDEAIRTKTINHRGHRGIAQRNCTEEDDLISGLLV
jgi:hypothetical protein